jgi:hypothetical protein
MTEVLVYSMVLIQLIQVFFGMIRNMHLIHQSKLPLKNNSDCHGDSDSDDNDDGSDHDDDDDNENQSWKTKSEDGATLD